MCVLLSLCNTQLSTAALGYHFAHSVMQVLLVVRYFYSLKGLLIARHGAIVERESLHTRLGHIFLCENDCELSQTVGAVIETKYYIARLDASDGLPCGICLYNGFYKLVGNACFV